MHVSSSNVLCCWAFTVSLTLFLYIRFASSSHYHLLHVHRFFRSLTSFYHITICYIFQSPKSFKRITEPTSTYCSPSTLTLPIPCLCLLLFLHPIRTRHPSSNHSLQTPHPHPSPTSLTDDTTLTPLPQIKNPQSALLTNHELLLHLRQEDAEYTGEDGTDRKRWKPKGLEHMLRDVR